MDSSVEKEKLDFLEQYMGELIGIIVFFSLMKKISLKFTDAKQIIPYLIGAVVLRNLGFFDIFGNSGIIDFINGFLNAVIVMGIIRLVTLKHREKKGENKSTENRDNKKLPNGPWEMIDEIFSDDKNKKEKKHKNEIPESDIPFIPVIEKSPAVKALTNQHALSIAQKAVLIYLQRRNFKTSPSKDPAFDITATDYQKKEFQIKIIPFAKDLKQNLIVLSADTYQKALNLGRNFILFVITETEEDDSSNYLGNYVKVYKVDSVLADIDFKKNNQNYEVSLTDISKHASDWETSIR